MRMTMFTTDASSRSILIINPNTTVAVTDGLRPVVDKLGFDTTHFEYFTAPSGVTSINNEEDAAVSAKACLPALRDKLKDHDAFLVCCYSQHPLVSQLRAELVQRGMGNKSVTGIFEASVAACLQSIEINEKFGVVSTGSQWTEILCDAVANFMGSKECSRYAGTETTGIDAVELHSTAKDEVDELMKQATKILLDNGAKAICLGCAGMAGMDQTVREACVETLGEDEGMRVKIVDGVVSGVVHLEGTLRQGL
ncbi:Protein dcg1 [Elasticomyces elasticus]|nr:Protein dcg1 [Elasticomyces elasticus]